MVNLSLGKFETVTLADVSINNKGEYGIGASAVDYSDELYTYLRITDINDDGTLNKNDLKSVDDDDAKNYLLNENDVVFARTGNSTGKAYYYDKMDGELVYAGFLIKFSLDPSKINPKFMKYYVLSEKYKGWVNSMCTGSTRPNINAKMYGNMQLILPPREQQDFLVNILDKIDKKIEINKRINKNLYNIIEARFKHYVKDFSNLDKVVLSDYCNDIIRGFNSKYVEKSNLINLNQKVNKGDILEKQYFKYLNDDIEVPKEKFAKRKDVLLNSLGDGTLGRVHYYNENTDNVIIDQHITIIRSDENKLPSSYIYQYLKCGAGQYHLNSLISGSTGMLMLNISHIRNLELPILPQKELFEFDNFAKDLFDKISSNTKEIEKLQKLRDTLLPKLMSGEIDVSKINCDLKIIIRKIYIKSSKLFLWRYLSENQNYIKNTKSNETLLKSRTIHKINKFLAKFNARYRYYRQQ